MASINKRNFVWGEVIKDHEIGDFVIREYIENKTEEVAFHLYTNGIDQHVSFETLETAIIGAIARKYDGPNTSADVYFYRSIDIEKKYE